MNRRLVLAALVAFAAAMPAMAQTSAPPSWRPSGPIRIIVPYGAGGAADTMARTFGRVLEQSLGQPVVIENRPGGGSITGTQAAARAAPDGQTFALAGMSTHVLAPAMNRNAGFDPVRDFTHVAYLGGAPNLFVVHPSLGVTSYRQFIAAAKGEVTAGELQRPPRQFEYVSPGLGSVGNLVAETLAAKEGIKLVHVPYKGGAEALTDLVAGHVKVGMMSLSTAREQVRAGKLIPIAVSSAARLADLPGVPTLAELGLTDLVATTWWALSAPAGLPGEIADAVNRAINASLGSEAVQRQLAIDGAQAKPMTPAELTDFMRSEVAKWSEPARRVGGN